MLLNVRDGIMCEGIDVLPSLFDAARFYSDAFATTVLVLNVD